MVDSIQKLLCLKLSYFCLTKKRKFPYIILSPFAEHFAKMIVAKSIANFRTSMCSIIPWRIEARIGKRSRTRTIPGCEVEFKEAGDDTNLHVCIWATHGPMVKVHAGKLVVKNRYNQVIFKKFTTDFKDQWVGTKLGQISKATKPRKVVLTCWFKSTQSDPFKSLYKQDPTNMAFVDLVLRCGD